MDAQSSTEQPVAPVLLGVVGAPAVVANSLSPAIFAAAFKAAGIAGYYVPLPVRERAARKALRGLARLGFQGVNVTMPYKQVAAEVAHDASELVQRTGVANTLLIDDSGHIRAEATDGIAVAALIQAAGVSLAGASVTLIGAGGAATEAAFACAQAGATTFRIWNRTREHGEQLVQLLDASFGNLTLELCPKLPIDVPAHVLIGAVPAAALAPQHLAGLREGPTMVVDFAYRADRRPTALIEAAHSHGKATVDGRALLVRQAAEAFRLWFGSAPPVEEMARAVA